jgi:hypothetical protein
MPKRNAEAGDGEDGNTAYLKRQKITPSANISTSAEEIRSAKQLQQTLAFDQDVSRLRRGGYINNFT